MYGAPGWTQAPLYRGGWLMAAAPLGPVPRSVSALPGLPLPSLPASTPPPRPPGPTLDTGASDLDPGMRSWALMLSRSLCGVEAGEASGSASVHGQLTMFTSLLVLHGKQAPFGLRHTHLHLADWLPVVNGQSISQDGGRILDGIASSELGLSRRRKLGVEMDMGLYTYINKGNKSGYPTSSDHPSHQPCTGTR